MVTAIANCSLHAISHRLSTPLIVDSTILLPEEPGLRVVANVALTSLSQGLVDSAEERGVGSAMVRVLRFVVVENGKARVIELPADPAYNNAFATDVRLVTFRLVVKLSEAWALGTLFVFAESASARVRRMKAGADKIVAVREKRSGRLQYVQQIRAFERKMPGEAILVRGALDEAADALDVSPKKLEVQVFSGKRFSLEKQIAIGADDDDGEESAL